MHAGRAADVSGRDVQKSVVRRSLSELRMVMWERGGGEKRCRGDGGADGERVQLISASLGARGGWRARRDSSRGGANLLAALILPASPHILARMHDSPPGGSPTNPWLDWRPCLTRAPRVPPGNSFPLCSRPPALRSRFTLDRRWFTLCCWLPRLAPCISASESHSHYARQPLLGQAYPYSCLIRPPLTQTAAHHHPAISNALHAA